MSDPMRLSLVVYAGLPESWPAADRDRAWKDCIEPLLGAFHHTPSVKVGFVLTSDLVEHLQEKHPEGIAWIGDLIARGQAEILGNTMYEPVLSSIPERDGAAQFAAHATLMKKVFGVRPTGCWLPNRAWDPAVPRILHAANMAYTFVDDAFITGLEPGDQAWGVYRTEREGCAVALLPTDTQLGGSIPDIPVKELFVRLKRRAQRGHQLMTLVLTAHQFGMRAGRNPRADQTWLATLIAGLAGAAPAIETVLPHEAAEKGPDRGRLYLPTAAPPALGVPWERHLVRYDEANRLHKRMLRTSRIVARLEKQVRDEAHSADRPDPEKLGQAQRYLWRSQQADVYWHGDHAGIYDPELRHRAWKDVVRAEQLALQGLKSETRMQAEAVDIDGDGVKEVLLRTPSATVVVDPARGAGLTELSLHKTFQNLVNTMTRVKEPYHADDAWLGAPAAIDDSDVTDHGEIDVDLDPAAAWDEDIPTQAAGPSFSTTTGFVVRDIKRGLGVDARSRVCLVEHLLQPEATLHSLRRGNQADAGKGFQDAIWELVSAERHGDEGVSAVLGCDFTAYDTGGERKCRFTKKYVLHREPTLDVKLELLNRSHEALRTRLAMELNLTLGPDAKSQVIVLPDGARRMIGIERDLGEIPSLTLEGPQGQVQIDLVKPGRVWAYPIQTVHRHLGQRRVQIQGVCLVVQWAVELWGKEKEKVGMTLQVKGG